MVYNKPQITTTRENASANRTDAGVFVNVGLIGTSSGGSSIQQSDIIRSSSPDLTDLIDPNLADASCSFKGFIYTKDVDFEVKSATGEVEWKSTTLTPPYIKSQVPSTLSGSLASGTYFYVVTAFKMIDAIPTYGETTISNEVSVQLSAQGTISLSWSKVDLADGYRIYRSGATGTETMVRELTGADKTSWDDTGLYTPGIVAFPVVNTATKRPPYSVSDSAAYWTGGDASTNLAGLQAVADGSLTCDLDGQGVIEVAGMDFSATGAGGLDASLIECAATMQTAFQPALGSKGYYLGADASINLTNLVVVTDGRISINIDGAGAVDTADIDFSTASDMDQCALLIQAAVQTATATSATCIWDGVLGVFTIYSDTRGASSSVAIAAPAAGTDLITASYCNFTNGAALAGVNSTVTVTYSGVALAFIITSPTLGTSSSVVMTEGAAGTPLGGAALAVTNTANGGAQTAGTAGTKITYIINATISGTNYFNPQQFFSISDIALAHGSASDIYLISERMMLPPPTGQGCKMMTIVGVPTMSRGAGQAALEELGKVDVDIVVGATTDIDILRDIANHCVYWSQDANKKERIPILSLANTQIMDNFVAFAAELSGNGDRCAVLFDNYSTENYIAALVGAGQASLRDRATSFIGTALNTSETVLNAGRVSDSAVEYLLSRGVMVLSKDDSGVLTVIDDLMADGQDITGRLVEDYMRKNIRQRLNALKGRTKLTDHVLTAVEEIGVTMLDTFAYNELINDYNRDTVVAERSPVNPNTIVLRFTYTRMQTLKIIDVRYQVLDQ